MRELPPILHWQTKIRSIRWSCRSFQPQIWLKRKEIIKYQDLKNKAPWQKRGFSLFGGDMGETRQIGYHQIQ